MGAMPLLRTRFALAAALILAGCLLVGERLWMAGKAWLAERLIGRAFATALATGKADPPWPGADFFPMAELIVPRLGVHRHVLSGGSGTSMAFGIGHLDGSAGPGEPGNCVLVGHRDSWMGFMRRLRTGDRLQMMTPNGRWTFSVTRLEIVDETSTWVTGPTPAAQLTLLTCYPFGALTGGRLRYVVRCRLISCVQPETVGAGQPWSIPAPSGDPSCSLALARSQPRPFFRRALPVVISAHGSADADIKRRESGSIRTERGAWPTLI